MTSRRALRNKKESIIDEDTTDSQDIDIQMDSKGLPPSQPGYDRRFIILKNGSAENSHFYKIRHPKFENGILYRVGPVFCEELLLCGEDHRSFFYGDSVIADGALRMCAPVHPLFIVLPYFLKKTKHFEELHEILYDEEFPGIAAISENHQFLNTIDAIADVKEVSNLKVYRINEDKVIQWLRDRFNRLQKALLDGASLHKSIIESKDVLDRYTFAILCDNLSTGIVSKLKEVLQITDPPADEQIENNFYKRRSEVDFEEMENLKPSVKKIKESVVQKQLKVASKGTKSISSFFVRINEMGSRIMPSRINHAIRGMNLPTPYGKRIARLSDRIFGEHTTPTDTKSLKVIRVMSAEPLEQKDQLKPEYYPNLPMFHYLTKMLRFHGLFFDDHVVFRQVQDELKILRGKVVRPPIGQGKRALLRNAKGSKK